MAIVFLTILLRVKVLSENLQTLNSGDNVKSEQLKGGKDAPLGFGPPTAMELNRSLADWSVDPDNEKAWKKMTERVQRRVETQRLGVKHGRLHGRLRI